MASITYPQSCELCSGKLHGAALLRIERADDGYYLNVTQTAPLDWGICPGCKLIACFAACWDKARGCCRFCPSFDAAGAAASAASAGNCPECRKELVGAIEIVQSKTNGIGVITFKETPDRNWIQCDGCSKVVCKACCRNSKSGYCNRCLSRFKPDEPKPNCPAAVAAVATAIAAGLRAYRFDSTRLSQATKTNTQNNSEDK